MKAHTSLQNAFTSPLQNTLVDRNRTARTRRQLFAMAAVVSSSMVANNSDGEEPPSPETQAIVGSYTPSKETQETQDFFGRRRLRIAAGQDPQWRSRRSSRRRWT